MTGSRNGGAEASYRRYLPCIRWNPRRGGVKGRQNIKGDPGSCSRSRPQHACGFACMGQEYWRRKPMGSQGEQLNQDHSMRLPSSPAILELHEPDILRLLRIDLTEGIIFQSSAWETILMGSVEERWLKMKFTGEFLKKLPFPPIVLSIKHFLNDYCVIEPQSSKRVSSCVREAVRTHRKAVERIVPLLVELST